MDKLVIVGAFQRWPTGGVMDKVTSTYQSLCDEQLATLVELSVSDADATSVNKSKVKKKSIKKKQMKGSANNG